MQRLGMVLVVIAVAFAGCGGDGASAERGRLVVSAAASLKQAFTAYAFAGADVKFSFAGSNELAGQIRQGVKPDVYAAANTTLPEELHAAGLVERPVVFASNRLVLAVPAESAIASLDDVAGDRVALAIGAEGVPIGAYTRALLDKLPARQRDAILANVRSEEPDVAGITGKLVQGAVDAGFLYVSDVRATGGKLRAVELPAEIAPAIAYAAAVVKGAKNPEQARAFIDGLVNGAGARALADAGFEPPPGR
jgi:molybdate transport system substrate-binding protein